MLTSVENSLSSVIGELHASKEAYSMVFRYPANRVHALAIDWHESSDESLHRGGNDSDGSRLAHLQPIIDKAQCCKPRKAVAA
jgi:hypothetical protein